MGKSRRKELIGVTKRQKADQKTKYKLQKELAKKPQTMTPQQRQQQMYRFQQAGISINF